MCHPPSTRGAIQGKEGIKFGHLATLIWDWKSSWDSPGEAEEDDAVNAAAFLAATTLAWTRALLLLLLLPALAPATQLSVGIADSGEKKRGVVFV